MKACIRIGIVLLTAMPLNAAEVGDLHLFTAGTPARAAEVNQNFADIKTVVNENAQQLDATASTTATHTTELNALNTTTSNHSTSLTTINAELTSTTMTTTANAAAITALQTSTSQLQTDKQNTVTGTCPSGEAIRAINSDGTVACQKAQLSGAVAVSPPAFGNIVDNASAACNFNRLGNLVLRGSSNYCEAVAPLTLPHNVKLSSLSCGLLDNHGGTGTTLAVGLVRANHSAVISDQLFTLNSQVGDSPQIQTLLTSDTIFGKDIVDNINYHYYLRLFFTTAAASWDAVNGISTTVHLRGCSVAYVAL